MTAPNDATRAQIRAARPGRSTWLSANAGSGKTRVLTDRVARLLLDGVDPQHILCLTYTKAAASEMQNRLFGRLGEWAMLDDGALRTALTDLGVERALDSAMLRHARRLFARAVETPGGLRIQTIHAFCAALLRRFPLEAGVSPQFTEADDRDARDLRARIVEAIAGGPQSHLLDALLRHYSAESLDGLTAEISVNRTLFAAPVDDAALPRALGQPADLGEAWLLRRVFPGDERALLDRLIPAMRQGSSTDHKNAAKLAGIGALDLGALPVLEGVLLTGKGAKSPFSAKIGSVPTKGTQKTIPDLMPRLDALMARVEGARPHRLALETMRAARALHDFARAFLPAYAQAKERTGQLDFDDLILRSRDLLTRSEVAAWVLYRLDGGIDHILVDEAQDTSPVQWQVIEQLAQEFTSGEGARGDQLRTIFVVGDKKQSIYSFQGADPRGFDRMRDTFDARLRDTDRPLQALELAYSFRSSSAVLNVVDATFSDSTDSGFTPDQSHIAFHATLPGRVDLWPAVAPPEVPEKPAWHIPVDMQAPDDPAIVLARNIVGEMRRMVETHTALPDADAPGGFRAVRPGDFLILVQRRDVLFHELIRECKAQRLPVAGADRLKIGGELAVRDLAALLAFLDTPGDSLSLATALRSPLFGWSEAQLYALAQGRGPRDLWEVLHQRRADHPETVAVIEDLFANVDYLRPYELLERILTRHHGRHALLSRLGFEAEDGIDALLSQAMAYEQRAVDSLTGFLGWLRTDDLEIKRQMDSAGDRIRVMTVHGAKGLEAPVVILPDSGDRQVRHRNAIVTLGGTPFLKPRADDTPDPLARVIEAEKAADQAERDRLLYVAMTRAETWLIVAAHGDIGDDGNSWHGMVRKGLESAGATAQDLPTGPGLRLQHGDWPEAAPTRADSDPEPLPDLPGHFTRQAPAPRPVIGPLSPSDMGGAKALPGEAGHSEGGHSEGGGGEEAAKRRGRQIHLLLEHLPALPRDDWPDMARCLLAHGSDAADPLTLADLLAEVRAVLDAPPLAPLFTPDALAEVPLTAQLDALGGRRIHGIVDRLIVTPDRVLAVDFKTNAVIPEAPGNVPEGLLRQMGAYAHALALIYPDRSVETALLWTRAAMLMPLPHDLVTAALARARSA